MVAGGWRTLQAIDNGIFEENKEYKYVKGLIVDDISNEAGKRIASLVYDGGSLGLSMVSLTKNVGKIFTLKGSELNKIVHAYASGADAVSIVIGASQLVIKLK